MIFPPNKISNKKTRRPNLEFPVFSFSLLILILFSHVALLDIILFFKNLAGPDLTNEIFCFFPSKQCASGHEYLTATSHPYRSAFIFVQTKQQMEYISNGIKNQFYFIIIFNLLSFKQK
jgi:hypothetical protein